MVWEAVHIEYLNSWIGLWCMLVCVKVFVSCPQSPFSPLSDLLWSACAVQWFPEHQTGDWIAVPKLNYSAWDSHVVWPSDHRETWVFQMILQSITTGSKFFLFFLNCITFTTRCVKDAFLYQMWLSHEFPSHYSVHTMNVSSLCEW